MKTRLFAPALALTAALTACGTPQEQCIATNTRELRTVERLISETEANLARGYAIETREVSRPAWVVCGYTPQKPRKPGAEPPPPKPRYCFDEVTETVRDEVAIDPAAERRKLAGLIERRKALSARAEAVVAACREKYPEAS